MHPLRRDKAQRGLTLIELMIGLGILAVLMSLAVPSFQTYLQRQRLKAAAQTLELDLKEARYEAARQGRPIHLSWDAGPDWCYAIATRPGCDCHGTDSCALKRVRAADLRGLQLVQAQGLRFDPATGTADLVGVAAVWQVRSGERLQVDVNAMGRPGSCMQDGKLPPLPSC